MSFQRLTIRRIDGSADPVEAQFNPAELTLSKGVQLAEIAIPGLDSPILQFVRGQSETLALDLFFDTTDQGTSVTAKTDAFYQLVKIDGATHAPPVCELSWGTSDFPGGEFKRPWTDQNRRRFKCVVESVRQRFTLFDESGTPLRATLSVTFREYKLVAEQLREIGFRSADHTEAHVVQQGDTLTRIAHDAYGDPARWREIAVHNGVDDPLALAPGRILELPPVG
jgi:nucleoid-associated protein YgaU